MVVTLYKIKYQMVGIRIPVKTMKKFRKFCVDLDLSVPKQTASLIENFVKEREREKELLKNIDGNV